MEDVSGKVNGLVTDLNRLLLTSPAVENRAKEWQAAYSKKESDLRASLIQMTQLLETKRAQVTALQDQHDRLTERYHDLQATIEFLSGKLSKIKDALTQINNILMNS